MDLYIYIYLYIVIYTNIGLYVYIDTLIQVCIYSHFLSLHKKKILLLNIYLEYTVPLLLNDTSIQPLQGEPWGFARIRAAHLSAHTKVQILSVIETLSLSGLRRFPKVWKWLNYEFNGEDVARKRKRPTTDYTRTGTEGPHIRGSDMWPLTLLISWPHASEQRFN